MQYGAHVSIAGGLDKSIERIVALGGNSLMTFASSPRTLQTKKYSEKDIAAYLKAKKHHNIGPHFFHGVYLVNLASEDQSHLEVSIDSLVYYQQLAGEIEGVGTIFHIGSHKGRGFTQTLTQIVQAINFVLDSTPKGVKLILENSAGQQGSVGATFDELSQILARIGDRSKIGICLDTQHCFAAGYDLKTVLDKFEKIIGLKYVSVIHCNDSKSDFNSHLDRHENLGEGKIGAENLKEFINDPRLSEVPFILEVPGIGDGPTKADIDTFKSLVG